MFYSAVEHGKSSISDKVSYFLSLIEIIFIRKGLSQYSIAIHNRDLWINWPFEAMLHGDLGLFNIVLNKKMYFMMSFVVMKIKF